MIETLAAMMISVLGMLMFAGAAMSGSRMISTSRTTLDAYYKENNNLTEEKNGSSADSAVDIAFTEVPSEMGGLPDNADLAEMESKLLENLVVYTNQKKNVASYRTSESKENDPADIEEDEEDDFSNMEDEEP